MRDNTSLPAGEGGGAESVTLIYVRVAGCVNAAKNSMEASRGDFTLQGIVVHTQTTQLVTRDDPMLARSKMCDSNA
jgi:hypothetical protein